jgi:perosamine synthetase
VIRDYQDAFAATVGAKYAFSFWKGRIALYAILQALGVGAGDEVVLPGFTCVVVANAVLFAGAKPVFADISRATYNLNPASVERAITPRTKALIVQHTFGLPADLDSLLALAEHYRLPVIEDCAHALGSKYGGKQVGTFGTASFFSSQWSKPFTTGLGGVAVTSNSETARRLQEIQLAFADPPIGQVLRLRAQYSLYQRFFTPRLYWLAVNTLRRMSELKLFVGSSGEQELNCELPPDASWRMSAFQAGLGLKRLQTLPRDIAHRRQLAKFYEECLQARGWPGAAAPESAESVYLRYPVRVANKWEMLSEAAGARIELGSWFESTLHPIRGSLERFGYHRGRCPVAEQAAAEVVNLPLHPRVSKKEAERIGDFFCKHARKPALHVEVMGKAVFDGIGT